MGTKNDVEAIKFILQWKIGNVSSHWWMNEQNFLSSPFFILEALDCTKGWLMLSLGNTNAVFVNLFRNVDCDGPESIEVECHTAFVGRDGSILDERQARKGLKVDQHLRIIYSMDKERIFVMEREKYLPEDTLTVQCTLCKAGTEEGREDHVKSKLFYAQTILQVIRKSFDCRIEKFSTLQSGVIKKIKGDLIEFGLNMDEDGQKLIRNIIPFHDSIKYISCNTSIIDSEGKKESFSFDKYFGNSDFQKETPISSLLKFPPKFSENKNRYFPNDDLFLDFNIVLSTVEDSDWRDSVEKVPKQKDENVAVLIKDLKSMYDDRICTDTEIKTSKEIFPVHKNILSARSPVFRKMFIHDRKKRSGQVSKVNLEDDTLHRMLLFMYTGLLEEMTHERAIQLYKAAHEYDISTLKSSCSAFMKDHLLSSTVLSVLLLAVEYRDEDLKNAVYDYMLEHNEVFRSAEWENFMVTDAELAMDIMYRKVNPGKI